MNGTKDVTHVGLGCEREREGGGEEKEERTKVN